MSSDDAEEDVAAAAASFAQERAVRVSWSSRVCPHSLLAGRCCIAWVWSSTRPRQSVRVPSFISTVLRLTRTLPFGYRRLRHLNGCESWWTTAQYLTTRMCLSSPRKWSDCAKKWSHCKGVWFRSSNLRRCVGKSAGTVRRSTGFSPL